MGGPPVTTEMEWEVAAASEPDGVGLSRTSAPIPGVERDTTGKANLDGRSTGCVDVAALAGGDSAWGAANAREYMGMDELNFRTLPWIFGRCLSGLFGTSILHPEGPAGRLLGDPKQDGKQHTPEFLHS